MQLRICRQMDSYRLAIFAADAYRNDVGRFIVRADENYPFLWNSNLRTCSPRHCARHDQPDPFGQTSRRLLRIAFVRLISK